MTMKDAIIVHPLRQLGAKHHSLISPLLLPNTRTVSGVPKEGTRMKNTKRKATKVKATVKRPKTVAKAATGVQAKAARRTAEGKFTKIIFNQIGGKECRRLEAMTWKERDACMARPENAAVLETLRKAFGLGRIQGVKPLFTLGQVVATPGALEKAGQQPGDFLSRHVSGD
jgi:hypothetical protein